MSIRSASTATRSFPMTAPAGVWVETVQPGSPADRAGITGGDIVTAWPESRLGFDGTMAEFCDVIRTQGEATG